MVCDTIHHDYPGSCPYVLQGFPIESADHLTGTLGGPVIPVANLTASRWIASDF